MNNGIDIRLASLEKRNKFLTYSLVPAALIAALAITGWKSGKEPVISPPSTTGLLAPQDAPVGTIVAFAGVFNESPNSNWRLCRGQSVLQSQFPALFGVIGQAWGKGDNPTTTFSLPDLRGMFLRGAAQGVSVDPDRDRRVDSIPGLAVRPGGNSGDKVGSLQAFATALPAGEDSFKTGGESNPHTHPASSNAPTESGPNTFGDGDERGMKGGSTVTVGNNSQGHTHTVVSGGNKETRPVNAAVNWIIRVK